ncbi:MAG: LacI family DNA-binding transcriptional regulator [Planctomycetota bacterium]
MPSVRDVARHADVSPATVSRVLNKPGMVSAELRDRVLRAVRATGYSPPERPVSNDHLGLVYTGGPVTAEFGGFDAAVVSGSAQAALEERFDVIVTGLDSLGPPLTTYTDLFRTIGIRGAVIRTMGEGRELCEAIAEEGFPAVVIGDRFDNPAVNYVCYDSVADSRRAVSHLADLGHKRIAMCIHMVRDSDHDDRRQAYRDALEAKGLEYDPELTVEVIADSNGGATAVNRLLSMASPPTAIFFTDPLSTVGGIRRTLEIGLEIPRDLSIVGFDDGHLRKLTYPPFTAVCQDSSRLATIATKWLAQQLRMGENVGTLRLTNETFFEVNRTTDVPPAQPVRVSPSGQRLTPKT